MGAAAVIITMDVISMGAGDGAAGSAVPAEVDLAARVPEESAMRARLPLAAVILAGAATPAAGTEVVADTVAAAADITSHAWDCLTLHSSA
jgi:hypothetical protein